MSEYIERGALSGFVRNVRKNLPKDSKDFFTRDEMLLNFQQYIDAQPAADVEPVVRCQKCKSWDKEKMFDGKCWCNDVSDHTESTFFCAHGKER